MPGFRFTLQRLLDLRSRAEDLAQARLADSQRVTAQEQTALAALEGACARAAGHAAAAPGELRGGAALLSHSLHLAHLRQQAAAQQQRVGECGQAEARHREELLATARERKVMDRLKDRRWQQYVSARDRSQQRWLDEAGVLNHYRQRTAG